MYRLQTRPRGGILAADGRLRQGRAFHDTLTVAAQPRRLLPGLRALVTAFFFTTRDAFALPAFDALAFAAAGFLPPPKIESQPSAYLFVLPTRITDTAVSL